MNCSSCRWNNLTPTSMNRLVGERGIQNPNLRPAYGFLAEWALTSRPLESLNDAGLACLQQILVYLTRQSIIQQDIGSMCG